jgi:transcriptional regulator with XRE-family HTH domain
MQTQRTRSYSRHSREAVALLGRLIRLHRKKRKLTAQDVADRVGINRTTLRKIETGNMKCESGLLFEVAALVGVKLFDAEASSLAELRERTDDRIALLPKTIRPSEHPLDDDF